MEIEPIDSLEELWSWKNRSDVAEEFLVELKNYKKGDNAENNREVLVCHDMKGGYLEEERKCGKLFEEGKYPYMFLNWWQIDIFNYFSHHFVTIPPDGYTRAAHNHGVLSLGTFITEWIPGKKLCQQILQSESTVEDTVDSLVAIARFYSFDGWLINIENVISPAKIDLLVNFCEKLTRKMRETNRNSRVIWYDSVLHSGNLLWQNCLNSENCNFYNACDGIYLNYNWSEFHLLESADYGKLNRIFVGIDVWGRGCLGGFDCWKSFAIAKLLRMSVAIFAPGWIYEKFPDENQIIKGIGFWQKLYPYVTTRKLEIANFSTDFCTGMKLFDKTLDKKWKYHISSVSLQPQCLSETCYQKVGEGLLLIGQNQKFRIFSFVSIPFSKLEVSLESSTSTADFRIILNEDSELTPITVTNDSDIKSIIFPSGSLESIDIETGNQKVTVIKNFSISVSEVKR